MTNRRTNLVAFAVLVLASSLILYGFIIGITKYADKHPPREKPGFSEIRTIAQENNLKFSDVSTAVKGLRDRSINLPKIIYSQTIYFGFVLGAFVLVRKLVSKFTERK